MTTSTLSAGASLDRSAAGEIRIGDLTVNRLGFGAMRIADARGPGGQPDRAEAVRLCRRVVERGVNFIDVADIYAFGACEEILAEALHPYPAGLVIATKAGFVAGKLQPGMSMLPPIGRPDHVKAACEQSLRRLRIDCIDLYQSHVPDPDVPYEDTIGAFAELQREGKVRHIGVSNVSLEQLRVAQSVCKVVSVQNRYNFGSRSSEGLVAACEADGLAFLPWRPVILKEAAQ
ncbi:MAG: aldo/keto reductase, partial [Caulobacteraceae bacterium]|nr:aldo/keto reductase [Caulobacteraceae bacterium]